MACGLKTQKTAPCAGFRSLSQPDGSGSTPRSLPVFTIDMRLMTSPAVKTLEHVHMQASCACQGQCLCHPRIYPGLRPRLLSERPAGAAYVRLCSENACTRRGSSESRAWRSKAQALFKAFCSLGRKSKRWIRSSSFLRVRHAQRGWRGSDSRPRASTLPQPEPLGPRLRTPVVQHPPHAMDLEVGHRGAQSGHGM